MKRIILLLGILVCLAAVTDVFSQSTEGVITYEVKMNQHRRIPKERESMKSMIPEFRIDKHQLIFKSGETLYKKVEEDSEEDMSSQPQGGNGGMRMTMRIPKVEIYTDLTNQSQLSAQEFMGKEYLVSDSIKIAPWKFGTETKMIQGHECKQAYYTDETRPERKMEITAWYAPDLIMFIGPDKYNTLPGTVLAVDIDNGERVFVAQSIEFRELKKNEIKKPTGGTKVTQAEYRAIVDEQLKKMGEGGGRTFIIRN